MVPKSSARPQLPGVARNSSFHDVRPFWSVAWSSSHFDCYLKLHCGWLQFKTRQWINTQGHSREALYIMRSQTKIFVKWSSNGASFAIQAPQTNGVCSNKDRQAEFKIRFKIGDMGGAQISFRVQDAHKISLGNVTQLKANWHLQFKLVVLFAFVWCPICIYFPHVLPNFGFARDLAHSSFFYASETRGQRHEALYKPVCVPLLWLK